MIESLNFINFDKFIAKGWILVDYWAPWCAPCLVQDPILNQLSDELSNEIQVAKVDIQDNKVIAQKQGIKNIPVSVLYFDGREIQRFAGLHSKQIMKNNIQKTLKTYDFTSN
jgi:thioredoxin 1